MTETSSNEVKIALVGDTGVGKTCIAVRFVSNSFNVNSPSTSGAAFLRKTIVVDEQAIKFQIWDTAGQEKFRSLTPMYYRSAAAAIIVFDVTRQASFDDVKYWVNEIQQKGTQGVIIYIVGNKIDMDNRQVVADVAQSYATSIKAFYSECSAATGEGVEDIFIALGRQKLKSVGTGEFNPIIDVEPKKGCC